MVHQVNKLRKAGGAYVTHDELAEILEPYRANWEALEAVSTEHDEKIQRIEGALEIDDLDAAIDELDGLEPLPDAVEGDTTEREAPAVPHPAESDPEGHELVEKIHEKKSRAKRKPEGQDPLGLVPDPEGDDS
jgi:hypothetical protein